MNLKTPHIVQSFISTTEQTVLRDWLFNEQAQGRLTRWNGNYFMGGYKFGDPENQTWEKAGEVILKPLQNVPDEFFRLRERIIDELGFHEFLLTPGNTAIGNVFLEGGLIQPHIDSNIEGHWHVRCNVLLSKPIQGGELVIDGIEYSLNECDLICFVADKHVHEVRRVIGPKKRAVVSYPMVMPEAWFEPIEL
jgi:hypothetical protein